MSRVVDAISPARLGVAYRRLLASSWITNLGDGVGLAAGPLLVASQTDRPFLVAMAALLQRLPWLMFGLYAGVIADRHDRKRIVVGANLGRAAVMLGLTLAVAADALSVGLVLVAVFVLGVAEVFADTTSGTLMPMIVESDDLGLANSRFNAGHVVVNQLAGPPLGAFLFAAGVAWPLVAQAVLFGYGAVVLARVALPMPERARRAAARSARDRRGSALAVAPRAGAHPDADGGVVQRHLRGGVVRAGAGGDRPAGHGQDGLRRADHGQCGGGADQLCAVPDG
jgi:MFS family permease